MEIQAQIKAFKQELILQKVSQYLEKHGYKNAKMADIAKFVGISVGALYKYFESKDMLFYAYVNYQIDTFYEHLKTTFATIQDPKERIFYFIQAKLKLFEEKRKLLTDTIAADPLFFIKLSATKENPAKKIYDLIAKELESIGVKDPIKASYLLNGITYGYIEHWIVYGGKLIDRAEEIYDRFFKGVE